MEWFAEWDAVLLARIQFAFTIAFHILFPAFTIGLASYLAVLEGLWLWRRNPVYLQLFKFWVKIFALTFGMGVVSGLVMSYQFGTNWSVFSDRTGPILGPMMGYEVLSAFFLEAGFLGIMLFGMDRVGKGLHFLSTAMVAVGTLFSTFWILSVNSWMHTPAGFAYNDVGQFVAADWWAVVFNPSFPYRLVHMVLAAYLCTAFAVGAVGAWHLLKRPGSAPARVMFSMAMWMAAIVAPLQIIAGDFHGLNTLEHQPAKVAAMEGHFETQSGAPLILFGIPDMAAETTHFALEIPKLGSLILTHDWDGELKGLKAWPPDERPNALIVFWSFRVMVAIGMLMALVGLISLYLRWRRQLFSHRNFLKLALAMGPTGFIAILAGWITTEVGRQPYTVYGLMRTSESISPIDSPAVAASLLAFVVVYLIVFGAGTVYAVRMMAAHPKEVDPSDHDTAPQSGKTPVTLSARLERPEQSGRRP